MAPRKSSDGARALIDRAPKRIHQHDLNDRSVQMIGGKGFSPPPFIASNRRAISQKRPARPCRPARAAVSTAIPARSPQQDTALACSRITICTGGLQVIRQSWRQRLGRRVRQRSRRRRCPPPARVARRLVRDPRYGSAPAPTTWHNPHPSAQIQPIFGVVPISRCNRTRPLKSGPSKAIGPAPAKDRAQF